MEYQFVRLPTNGKETRSEQVEQFASAELNREWIAHGWEAISATQPTGIGRVGFLLRRQIGQSD